MKSYTINIKPSTAKNLEEFFDLYFYQMISDLYTDGLLDNLAWATDMLDFYKKIKLISQWGEDSDSSNEQERLIVNDTAETEINIENS